MQTLRWSMVVLATRARRAQFCALPLAAGTLVSQTTTLGYRALVDGTPPVPQLRARARPLPGKRRRRTGKRARARGPRPRAPSASHEQREHAGRRQRQRLYSTYSCAYTSPPYITVSARPRCTQPTRLYTAQRSWLDLERSGRAVHCCTHGLPYGAADSSALHPPI